MERRRDDRRPRRPAQRWRSDERGALPPHLLQRRLQRRQHRRDTDSTGGQRQRWVISYADLLTLLFALFVVMYAASSLDREQWRQKAITFGQGLIQGGAASVEVGAGAALQTRVHQRADLLTYAFWRHDQLTPLALPPLSPPSSAQERLMPAAQPEAFHPLPLPPPLESWGGSTTEAKDDALLVILQELQRSVAGFIDRDLIRLRRNSLGLEVEIKNQMLFESGSAALNPEADKPLQIIAEVLKTVDNRLRVEGFTDDRPINTTVYPSNWELSSARAATVVHLLMKQGVAPHRMAAVGYGQYQPVADNDSPAGRARNRRVVLVILEQPQAPNGEPRRLPKAIAGQDILANWP